MIYKPLNLLLLLVFLLGTNVSFAQDEPCDCTCDCFDAIDAAVEAVMLTSGCDDPLWEAPHALEVHLKKLENWCGPKDKPLKSKVPNIVEGMLETIQDARAGESYVDPISGETIVVHVPAPECALEALGALEDLLELGCP